MDFHAVKKPHSSSTKVTRAWYTINTTQWQNNRTKAENKILLAKPVVFKYLFIALI
jgi:hypothetical protein